MFFNKHFHIASHEAPINFFFWTHPALRRRGDVVTTSPCTSQRRRRYVPNETPNDVSKWRNNDVSSVRLPNVSNKSQTQWRVSGTLPRRLSSTFPRRPISTSLQRLLQVPNKTPKNVVVVRLHHFPELRFCDVLLVGLCYTFKLLWHNLSLVGF